MTPLDQALAGAQSGDKDRQGAYYTLLVNTVLFFPVWEGPGQTGARTAGPGEKIKPVVIEQPDGHSYLMVFDTEERLGAWASREIGFVGMSGGDALRTFGTEMRWCLNVGTGHMKLFVAEELAWLASSIGKGP